MCVLSRTPTVNVEKDKLLQFPPKNKQLKHTQKMLINSAEGTMSVERLNVHIFEIKITPR